MVNQNSPKLVEAITTPLGFFVLSLLIVETFLGSAFFSNIDAENKIICIWLGVSLFVFVVIIVSLLVWFKADNLTFDNKSHLIDRGKIPAFGTSDNPISAKTVSKSKRSTPIKESD